MCGPPIAWFGLNPSTADGERDDPTMWREIGFSFRWGFGSLIKLNIYPFVTSKPANLRAILRENKSWDARNENIKRIRSELARTGYNLVAAWGAGVAHKEAADFLTELFWDQPAQRWRCLGITKDGSPIHTLARGRHRVPDSAKLIEFEPPVIGPY